jgi:D-alanine-D-alanine ligase
MSKRTVLLAFGGESSEHEVSIASARNVYAALDNSKYEIKLCYIDKLGKWWLLDEWTETLQRHGGTQLLLAPGTGSLITLPGSQVLHPDVILPILHGKNGEDGTIQGLAQLAHIPIVGCNAEASALCMNKHQTKLLLAAGEVPVVDWIAVVPSKINQALEDVSKLGDAPWFVKPARAGSSVGVSKVAAFDDLREAIDVAFKHDDLVLIEKAVIGRELEVAVLGNPPSHQASGVGEIIPGAEFYDYDDKYSTSSKSQVELDADLPEELKERIRTLALHSYELLGCSGLARVDFLLSEDGTPFVNEINTLPGFTNISMYPKLWQRAGMRYPELIDRLIDLAFE